MDSARRKTVALGEKLMMGFYNVPLVT
eukprot:COSAG02_NODE_30000_length_559_cov_0.693478_1_plen_26_part_10